MKLIFLGALIALTTSCSFQREACYAEAKADFFETVDQCDSEELDLDACEEKYGLAEKRQKDQEACR